MERSAQAAAGVCRLREQKEILKAVLLCLDRARMAPCYSGAVKAVQELAKWLQDRVVQTSCALEKTCGKTS